MLEVMVQNLYNSRVRTIKLPASDEEVKEFFEILNPGGLHDCEVVNVEITGKAPELTVLHGLHDLTFSELNRLAKKLEEDPEFALVFMACDNLDEAIKKFDNGDYRIYRECENDYDLGYEIATDLGIVKPNENSVVAQYFDFEAYGRDRRLNGDFKQVLYDTFVEITY